MLSLLEDSSLDPLRPQNVRRLVKTDCYAVPESKIMTRIMSPRCGKSAKQASQGIRNYLRGGVLRGPYSRTSEISVV